MKTCPKCQKQKPVDEFKGPYCGTCKKAYERERYLANHTRRLRQKKAERQRAAQRNHEIVLEALKDGCVKCGEDDFRCLEFDHIDPSTKEFIIADARAGRIGVDRLQKEIDKCQVLCSNCHRKKTAEQFGWFEKFN